MSALFLILFLATPLYVWRFSITILGFSLPLNFLMVVCGVVIIVGLIEIIRRSLLKDFVVYIKTLPRTVGVALILISLASIISLFAFGVSEEKLGQWVVLYVQPLIVFLILSFFAVRNPQFIRQFKIAAYLFLLVAGLLAILQYFTLWTLPMDWQGNMNEPKRAIGFFAHPNAFALFTTPLLAWLIPDVVGHLNKLWGIFKSSNSWWQEMGVIVRQRLYLLAWLVGAFGLLLSLSRGAWLGLLVAAGLYAILSANKKVLLSFLLGFLIIAGVVAAVPNLRWRVMLPFYGEKSSLARLSLWDTGTKMIIDSPILGKGLSGFDTNWNKFNTDPNLDHYNFPHNIFLNFWVDLGLLGLLGFLILILWIVWQGIIRRNNPMALSLLLFMVAVVVHGLIDIPYLKNDLALEFWMIMAISITSSHKARKNLEAGI